MPVFLFKRSLEASAASTVAAADARHWVQQRVVAIYSAFPDNFRGHACLCLLPLCASLLHACMRLDCFWGTVPPRTFTVERGECDPVSPRAPLRPLMCTALVLALVRVRVLGLGSKSHASPRPALLAETRPSSAIVKHIPVVACCSTHFLLGAVRFSYSENPLCQQNCRASSWQCKSSTAISLEVL